MANGKDLPGPKLAQIMWCFIVSAVNKELLWARWETVAAQPWVVQLSPWVTAINPRRIRLKILLGFGNSV